MLHLIENPTENKGRFFVVYGPNNVGKSAAIEGVKASLVSLGMPFKFVKYPISDLCPTGPRLEAYLRRRNPEGLTPVQAQQIFADNRRAFEPVLTGDLAAGHSYLAEDYIGTGLAWGRTHRVPITRLESFNNGLLAPDLSILVYGRRFTSGIEANHTHESCPDIVWQRNQRIHLALAKIYGWTLVSNEGKTPQEVAAEVSGLVHGYLTTRQGLKI